MHEPMLILDLVRPILAVAMRQCVPRHHGAHLRGAHDSNQIATLLNVIHPATVPDLSYAVILSMPWVDTDVACQTGNLWLLDILHSTLTRPPYNRPFQYTYPRALALAASAGHVHVFDWWERNIGALFTTDRARWVVLEAASAAGHAAIVSSLLPTFESWSEQPAFPDDSGLPHAPSMRAASIHGHCHILDVWFSLGYPVMDGILDGSVLAHVIVADALPALLWWLDHVQGSIPHAEATSALTVACLMGHRIALDHLLRLPPVRHAFTPSLAAFSCATGDLDFIQYCQRVAGQLNNEVSYLVSLAFGHVPVLDWLYHQALVFPSVHTSAHWENVNGFLHLLPQRLGPLKRLVKNCQRLVGVNPYTAACLGGQIKSLDWLIDRHAEENQNRTDMLMVKIANDHGYVEVLDWLLKHRPAAVEAYHDTAQLAVNNGHTHVLDWWLQNLPSAVESLARRVQLDVTVKQGYTDMLQWWQQSPFKVVFNSYDVSQAVLSGLLSEDGVRWWIDSGKPISLIHEVVCLLSEKGQVKLLTKLICSRKARGLQVPRVALPLKVILPQAWDWLLWCLDPVNYDILDLATFPTNAPGIVKCGNAIFLDMCWRAGLIEAPFPIVLPPDGEVDDTCIAVWTWALSTGMKLRYKVRTLHEASRQGRVHVLEWFAARLARFEFLEVPNSLADIGVCGPAILDWWTRSGLIVGNVDH